MEPPTTEPSSSANRLFTTTFVLLLVVQFAYGNAFSTMFALPKYLISELGADATLVGNAHGAFALTGALSVPLVGMLTDRYGRRPVWIAGLLLAIASYAPFGWAQHEVWILALRALHGLSFSMVFAAGGTLVVDVAPPERRAEAVGYFGIAMLTTNAIGPAFAEGIATGFGWTLVFVLCSGYAAVATVAAVMLRAPEFEPNRGAFSIPRSWPLAGAYFASLAVGIGVGVSKTFIPASLTQAGEPIGLYFVAYTAGAMLQRLGLGWLPDRLGRARATVLSLVVYAVAMLIVAMLQANWMLLLAPAIGMAHGMAYPASAALSVDLCAPGERGRVTALCAGFFNLGFAISASGLAPLEPWLGYEGLIAVGGAMLMVCAAGVARLVRERPRVAFG